MQFFFFVHPSKKAIENLELFCVVLSFLILFVCFDFLSFVSHLSFFFLLSRFVSLLYFSLVCHSYQFSVFLVFRCVCFHFWFFLCFCSTSRLLRLGAPCAVLPSAIVCCFVFPLSWCFGFLFFAAFVFPLWFLVLRSWGKSAHVAESSRKNRMSDRRKGKEI